MPHRNLVFGSIPAMSSTAIRCHGCGRFFTPLGLSQHISRTRRTDCRSAHDLFHMQSPPRSTLNLLQTLPQLPLDPNAESWDTTEQPEFGSLPLPGSDHGGLHAVHGVYLRPGFLLILLQTAMLMHPIITWMTMPTPRMQMRLKRYLILL